jgi:hypothetical protein
VGKCRALYVKTDSTESYHWPFGSYKQESTQCEVQERSYLRPHFVVFVLFPFILNIERTQDK